MIYNNEKRMNRKEIAMGNREEKLEKFKKEYCLNDDDLTLDIDNQVLLCGVPLDEWHKRMWDWLVIYGQDGATKRMFIDANFEDGSNIRRAMILSADCFACLYDKIFNEKDGCELCPIGRFDEENDLGCLDGLFFNYVATLKEEESRQYNLAKRIANLNWKWKSE